jgi:hypothetical protein
VEIAGLTKMDDRKAASTWMSGSCAHSPTEGMFAAPFCGAQARVKVELGPGPQADIIRRPGKTGADLQAAHAFDQSAYVFDRRFVGDDFPGRFRWLHTLRLLRGQSQLEFDLAIDLKEPSTG